ncbi:MAG: protein phosphatase 2C domain-containing protein [Micrococcales bacterium]|nr:protein phosphatase 2C domain-containing protein [Micrococcales bacterium]
MMNALPGGTPAQTPLSTPFAVIEAAALTDVGLVRQTNEDAVVASYPVYLVADGMGGHDAGRKASEIVAEELGSLAGSTPTIADVRGAIDRADERVASLTNPDPHRRAGATLSGVIVLVESGEPGEPGEPYWLVVNVGDSRTYRLAHGNLEQLSTDHSEIQELVDSGKVTPDEARSHPRRHVVTRAIGSGHRHTPDYWLIPMGERDRILICSDGLTDELDDAALVAALSTHASPGPAAESLLLAALQAGGRDNVSVVIVDAWDVRASGGVETTRGDLADEDTITRDQVPVAGGSP